MATGDSSAELKPLGQTSRSALNPLSPFLAILSSFSPKSFKSSIFQSSVPKGKGFTTLGNSPQPVMINFNTLSTAGWFFDTTIDKKTYFAMWSHSSQTLENTVRNHKTYMKNHTYLLVSVLKKALLLMPSGHQNLSKSMLGTLRSPVGPTGSQIFF